MILAMTFLYDLIHVLLLACSKHEINEDKTTRSKLCSYNELSGIICYCLILILRFPDKSPTIGRRQVMSAK